MKTKPVIFDIILTLLTVGIWNLWVQLRQIGDVDDLLGDDEHIPSPSRVVLFTILTFGIYFCYHEYSLTKRLHILRYGKRAKTLEVSFFILTLIGLWFIVDSYQQMLINEIIEKRRMV